MPVTARGRIFVAQVNIDGYSCAPVLKQNLKKKEILWWPSQADSVSPPIHLVMPLSQDQLENRKTFKIRPFDFHDARLLL
jgi:hypothetical protein